MRVTAVVSVPDQEVEVHLTMEDIAAAVRERDPETMREAICGIGHVHSYLAAIPDSFIAEMTPQQRTTVHAAFAKQAARYAETPPKPGTVADITDANLLSRAVRNLARLTSKRRPLWGMVMDTFGLGSTYSQQLCARFGLDPDTGKEIGS